MRVVDRALHGLLLLHAQVIHLVATTGVGVQVLDPALREDRNFAAAQFAQALQVLRIALSVAAATLRIELVTRLIKVLGLHMKTVMGDAPIDHVRVLGVPLGWVD